MSGQRKQFVYQTASITLFSVPTALCIYDNSQDYFEYFADSDAMIHDCGSFIGEYLHTEKPCCYMLKNLEQVQDGLLPLGQACMENYYKALSENDIISFIEEVVIKRNDPLAEARVNFVRSQLKVNYPNASQKFVQMLEKTLL